VDAQDLPDGNFLGVGSFGSVRETEWLGQKHAKKVFGDASHWSFKMESEVLADLSHTHLLKIVGSSVNGRGKLKYALVMELMQEDLSEFLKRTTVPLSILTALDLMLQVARGLKYLHSRRIVHRDLKSANILVASLPAAPELEYSSEPRLNAKLEDFGLSKTKILQHRILPPDVKHGHSQMDGSRGLRNPSGGDRQRLYGAT
jgi:serine/threonine protein kinase